MARSGLVQRLRPWRRLLERMLAAIERQLAPDVGDVTNEGSLLAVPPYPDGEILGCDTRTARARTATFLVAPESRDAAPRISAWFDRVSSTASCRHVAVGFVRAGA